MTSLREFVNAHVRLLFRQQARAKALQRELAEEVAAAIKGCPEEVYTPGCHAAVMRDLDAIYDRYYGVLPGDRRARWDAVLTANARDAYETVWRLSAAIISRHLSRFDPDLLTALREMAKGG